MVEPIQKSSNQTITFRLNRISKDDSNTNQISKLCIALISNYVCDKQLCFNVIFTTALQAMTTD